MCFPRPGPYARQHSWLSNAFTTAVLGTATLLLGGAGCADDDSSSSKTIDIQTPQEQSASPSTRASGTSGRSASTQPTTRSAGSGATDGGSAGQDGNGASDTLTGTWVADGVGTSAGDVKIRLQFKEQGPAHLVAISGLPFVGEVRNMESPYQVEDGKIVAPNIRGGVTMPYHFEGNQLVLEYKPGQKVRFNKTKEEDGSGGRAGTCPADDATGPSYNADP